jgi:methylglutaconyl-CoA hydratase
LSPSGGPSGEQVQLTRGGGVARVLLNRPEKRNALSASLVAALLAVLREAAEDDAVRVVTLRGAGPDFCAGADLGEIRDTLDGPLESSIEDVDRLAELFLTIRALRVPVVALVTGRALAGGCGLATACDLVLAAEGATFGYPEVRLGFVPAMVGAILRRNVSEKRAFELMTLGETISAAAAERLGLINRVFVDDEFERSAEEYVERLASSSPTAIQLCKRVLYRQDGLGFEAGVGVGADLNVVARMTADFRAGLERFARRRSEAGS